MTKKSSLKAHGKQNMVQPLKKNMYQIIFSKNEIQMDLNFWHAEQDSLIIQVYEL